MRLVPLVVLLPAIASVIGLGVGRIRVLAAAGAVTGTGAAGSVVAVGVAAHDAASGPRVSLLRLENVVHGLSAPAA